MWQIQHGVSKELAFVRRFSIPLSQQAIQVDLPPVVLLRRFGCDGGNAASSACVWTETLLLFLVCSMASGSERFVSRGGGNAASKL